MGSVRLYGATSGYLELQAPDVSPDAALVLPSTGFGKVLQVVRATATVDSTTTSSSMSDSNLSVSISPTKSTSTVLIVVSIVVQPPANARGKISITDSSNNNISGVEDTEVGGHNYTSIALYLPITRIAYATPATTSSVTYKLRFSTSGGTFRIDNTPTAGQIYAIEVAA